MTNAYANAMRAVRCIFLYPSGSTSGLCGQSYGGHPTVGVLQAGVGRTEHFGPKSNPGLLLALPQPIVLMAQAYQGKARAGDMAFQNCHDPALYSRSLRPHRRRSRIQCSPPSPDVALAFVALLACCFG